MRIRSFYACAALVAAAACQPNDAATPTTPPSLLTAFAAILLSGARADGHHRRQPVWLRPAPASERRSARQQCASLAAERRDGAGDDTQWRRWHDARLDAPGAAARKHVGCADIDAGYRSLIGLLAGLDPTTTFNIANSIWADSTLSVLSSFLSADQTNFGAEVHAQNLHAAATIDAINAWVNQKTDGKIPTIVKSIPPTEVMLLINAGSTSRDRGARPLTRRRRSPRSSLRSSGGTQSVPTMTLGGTVGYFVTTDAGHLVELPYGNGAYAMTIILPGSGRTIADLVNEIDLTHFAGWVGSMVQIDLGLTLPKFTFAYTRTLNDDLSALGMRRAFDSVDADFRRWRLSSRMSGST